MTDSLIDDLTALIGAKYVLTGEDAAPWAEDWSGMIRWTPLAVLRPANTAEIAAIVRLANATSTPVVPISGNTGLAKGTLAEGSLMISLDRLNAIRGINPAARTATVEAGVILSSLHEAADAHDLIFPLTFGL